jgi:hypothetical protein
MATKRLTANDYCKELHRLRLDQMALEKRIRSRATELIKKNPYVVIVENYMGSEGNLLAKNLQDLSHISIERVLDFITIIEADLASKHPHKQTKIEFSAEELQTQFRETDKEGMPISVLWLDSGEKMNYYETRTISIKMKCPKSPNGLHQFGFDGSTCSHCGANVAYL